MRRLSYAQAQALNLPADANVKVVRRGTGHGAISGHAHTEPEFLEPEVACRGGAFGDVDLCLAHEGHRIYRGNGPGRGRCVYVLTPVGEDVP